MAGPKPPSAPGPRPSPRPIRSGPSVGFCVAGCWAWTTAPNAVNNPRVRVAYLSFVRKNILWVAPLIQIIRKVIDSFSEAQGLSHVSVETPEPANWSKEVLDCGPAAG